MKSFAGWLLVLAICFPTYAVLTDCGNDCDDVTPSGDAAASASAAVSTKSSANGDGKSTAAAATAAATAAGSNDAAVTTASAEGSATSIQTSPGWHVPCNCDCEYDPVCGNDGRTYSNPCELQCISEHNAMYGNSKTPLRIHKPGECPRHTYNCSHLSSPVCGTDGVTYLNGCHVTCEASRRQTIGLLPIEIAHKGSCRRPICSCSDLQIPVCGTDGLTYKNIGALHCSNIYNLALGKPAVHKHYHGPCKQDNCNCPLFYKPVCASNGKTYQNYHFVACENRRRYHLHLKPLTINYNGRCINCRCPKIYDPVCCDGVTYLNKCILACHKKRRVSQRPALPPLKYSRGVCPCICPLIYDPVCGSDRRTYSNKCFFNCENKKRSHLGWELLDMTHGQCPCDCAHCPLNFRPVCGSDGKTYWNQCWMDCNKPSQDMGHVLYVRHHGPCSKSSK